MFKKISEFYNSPPTFNRRQSIGTFFIMIGLIFLVSIAYSAEQDPWYNYEIVKVGVVNPTPSANDNTEVRVEMSFNAHENYFVQSEPSISLDYWIDGEKQSSEFYRYFPKESTLVKSFRIRLPEKEYVDVTFEVNANQDKDILLRHLDTGDVVTVTAEKTYSDNRKTVRIYIDNPVMQHEYVATPTLQNHPQASSYMDYEGTAEGTVKTGVEAKKGTEGYNRPSEEYRGQTPLERMIASLFTALAQGIYDILGIKDPLVLIFDYEPMFDLGNNHIPRSELILGVFTEGEMSSVATLYRTFEVYLPIWFIIAIVITGAMLVFAGFGGDQRLTLKQYLAGIGIGMAMLAFGPIIMEFVFSFAYMGVDIIKELIERTASARGIVIPKSLLGLLLSGFMSGGLIIDNTADFVRAISGITGLMYAIILFLIFVGAGVLTWQYIVRKITLGVLIFMFPIVAALTVFPNTRGVLKLWMAEFFSNVFLVVAHAVVYGFLIMISVSETRTFGPLEIMIFILGLNGTIGIVRRMFGAYEQSGVLGGAGAVLGLSSIIGLSRVAIGAKGGAVIAGGLKAGNTAQAGAQMAQVGTGAQTAMSSAQGMKNTIQAGNDLTPKQAELMAAQQSGNVTPQQQAELDTTHRDLQPQQEQPSVNPSLRNKVFRMGGAVAIGSVGALATGMVTGKSTPGMAFGGFVGYQGTGKAIQSVKNVGQAVKDPQSMGIYDSSQLLDTKSAVQIGKNIAGKPGAVIGWGVNKVAQGLNHTQQAFAGKSQGIDVQSVSDNTRSQLDNNYTASQQEFHQAGQDLQLAQSNLQQVDLSYSTEEKASSTKFKDEEHHANIQLEEAKRNYQIKQLQFREAEIMKGKEHEYVAQQLKMSTLQRNINSDGGIRGQKWRT